MDDPALQAPSPMGELPMGAEFGTVVHAVFEAVDAAAPDLPGQLQQACAAALSRVPAGELTGDRAGRRHAAVLPDPARPAGR